MGRGSLRVTFQRSSEPNRQLLPRAAAGAAAAEVEHVRRDRQADCCEERPNRPAELVPVRGRLWRGPDGRRATYVCAKSVYPNF